MRSVCKNKEKNTVSVKKGIGGEIIMVLNMMNMMKHQKEDNGMVKTEEVIKIKEEEELVVMVGFNSDELYHCIISI